MRNTFYRQVFYLFLAVLSIQQGWAQGATTSAMNGVITDKDGAGLPGATVIAVHTPTNTQYVAPTNSEGRFNIQNMRVGGPYTVRITFVGYQDVTREGIFLTLGQNQRLDINLSESTQQLSEVTVSGRRDPVINSGRTGAATSVQREQIERLPSLSRSFQDFTRLTPQASGNGTSFGGRNGNFNNVTIDGAIFNNSFGLSGTVGGQAGAQPISLDAIQEIQVSIAPFDVRQGSFTGAGINAITRSGTNEVSASVYGFRRSNSLVGDKVRDINQPFPEFTLNQLGARVGGPIIKDKLFYFVSVEGERRDDPPGTFVANRQGVPAPGPGSNTSAANASELDVLSNFLQTTYGYNPGPYEGYQLKQNSDKITAKIDWNINATNTFSIKYNYLKSYRDAPPSNSGAPTVTGGRGLSANTLPFLASYYRINNNLNSFIAELNTTLAGGISNQLQAGFTAQRDFRSSLGGSPFPFVDILYNANGPGANGNEFTSFGYELFTPINVLNSDIYQLSDNISKTVGNHTFTLGTYNEYYKFANGFAPDLYGRYRFNSLTDFYNSAGYSYNTTTLAVTPRDGGALASATNNYTVRYPLNINDGNPSLGYPLAETKAAQLGFYAQDEWNVMPNLKVTTGLRVDIPIILSDLQRNEDAASISFRNNYQILTDQVQKTSVMFSPRVGFNWDVNNDGKTQLRGGTGIFTGRVPFVWISNQASNNGLLGGVYSVNGTTTTNGVTVPDPLAQPFNATPGYLNPNAEINQTRLPATYNLAVTERGFKFPQVWRTNIGIDQRLPGDVVFTLDGIFTKDINAVYFDNVNLPNPQARAAGADNRPIYRLPGALNTRSFQVSPKIVSSDGAIVMRNTSKGYSYSATAQLQKTFSNSVSASLAYTYTNSQDVSIGGSTPFSLWSARPISDDPNANKLGYSEFLRQHRVIASLSYRKEYLGHLATTISGFLDLGPNGRFSYVYNGDMNGDNVGTNDLMYIPRTRSEINLTNLTLFSGTPQQTIYTADQQWIDLDNYINQDDYLSKNRGEIAERNGAVLPWVAFIDARILQDVFTNIGKNRNSLQFSLDVFNIGNLINSDWGVGQTQQRSSPLSFVDYDQATGQPRFNFNPIVNSRTVFPDGTTTTNVQTLNVTNRYLTTESSRYRIQLGLRYTFN
ncbi:carboxypeptidase regulatory-like domain-containing protein [Hymenobacter tibetensis]|uniref:Carboxypeptidase regulatory-like domain-containing protein n=1 Tax=Hymenobacter tibetensis TaxID=497967 RepID=A0ABY4D061_9BACT|nr:TonB-dependent receptor [Hymenobacter tibetensis]UOG75921.1 carboxypeptidase regulatory-like domain-containing protein [Hymenobacter tibetensis]